MAWHVMSSGLQCHETTVAVGNQAGAKAQATMLMIFYLNRKKK